MQNLNEVKWGTYIARAFANIFFFYYETNFFKNNISFFRYIDDIIVFNWDNFENISFSVYPKGLVLKNTNSTNFSAFLDLKINFATKNWVISVDNKRLDIILKLIIWLTGLLALAKKF